MRALCAVGVVLLVAIAPSATADDGLPIPGDVPTNPNSLPEHAGEILHFVERTLGQQIPTTGPDCTLGTDSATGPYPEGQPLGSETETDPEGTWTRYTVWVYEQIFMVIESCPFEEPQEQNGGEGPL